MTKRGTTKIFPPCYSRGCFGFLGAGIILVFESRPNVAWGAWYSQLARSALNKTALNRSNAQSHFDDSSLYGYI